MDTICCKNVKPIVIFKTARLVFDNTKLGILL